MDLQVVMVVLAQDFLQPLFTLTESYIVVIIILLVVVEQDQGLHQAVLVMVVKVVVNQV